MVSNDDDGGGGDDDDDDIDDIFIWSLCRNPQVCGFSLWSEGLTSTAVQVVVTFFAMPCGLN
jgi:hypothetical protein